MEYEKNKVSISIFIFGCIFYSSMEKCSNDKYSINLSYHKINIIKICLHYFHTFPLHVSDIKVSCRQHSEAWSAHGRQDPSLAGYLHSGQDTWEWSGTEDVGGGCDTIACWHVGSRHGTHYTGTWPGAGIHCPWHGVPPGHSHTRPWAAWSGSHGGMSSGECT